MQLPAWSPEEALKVIALTSHEPGPVLVTLQGIQDHFGYVPDAAVALIALTCNVSRADVHGVLTFYHDLRTDLPAKTQIHICVAEACQSMGARKVVTDAKDAFATNTEVEIKDAYCLGNCALAPAASINGKLRGRVSAESLVEEVNHL